MKMADITLAGCAILAITSAALAQQTITAKGMITKIDRTTGTIAIQRTQEGTVGANTGGAAEEFKVQGGGLDAWHAGDRVSFTATEAGGTKTISKIEKDRP